MNGVLTILNIGSCHIREQSSLVSHTQQLNAYPEYDTYFKKIEVKSHNKTSPFKVTFSLLTILSNHHLDPVPKLFHHPKESPKPVKPPQPLTFDLFKMVHFPQEARVKEGGKRQQGLSVESTHGTCLQVRASQHLSLAYEMEGFTIKRLLRDRY